MNIYDERIRPYITTEQALRAVVQASSSSTLLSVCDREGIEIEDALAKFKTDPSLVAEAIRTRRIDDIRFFFGVLGTLTADDFHLREMVLDRYSSGFKLDNKAKPAAITTRMSLCPDSESKLTRAIDNSTAVVVNGGLVVKVAEGFKTGLCVKTFETKSGIFVEGNWYSPENHEERVTINDNYLNGVPRFELEGRWLLMRGVRLSTYPELLNNARRIAEDPSYKVTEKVLALNRQQYLNYCNTLR